MGINPTRRANQWASLSVSIVCPVLAVAASLVTFAAPATAHEPMTAQVALSLSGGDDRSGMASAPRQKEMGISSQLLGPDVASESAKSAGSAWVDEQGKILVDVVLASEASGRALLASFEDSGLELRRWIVPARAEVWLPPSLVFAVRDFTGVHFVRPALRPDYAIGSVTDSEVADSGTDAWHAAGFTGAGIRVGVIDGFFDSYAATQSSGDWPTGSQLEIRDLDGGGLDTGTGNSHGTTMVEILYDFAPAATYVVYDGATISDVVAAFSTALSDDLDILIFTGSSVGEGQGIGDGQVCPPYLPAGCGSLGEAIASARAAGIFVVVPSHNYGDAHWIGPYADHPTEPGTHDWGGGSNLLQISRCLTAGLDYSVQLMWDDYVGTASDYDLFVYRLDDAATGAITEIAVSSDPQSGAPGERPWEFATFTTSGETLNGCGPGLSNYLFLVERITPGASNTLRVFSPFPLFNPVPTRSIHPPGDVSEAYTVASVDGATGLQYVESSRGPVLGAGGSLGPPPAGLVKPNVSADGAAERSNSPGTFEGTSVAAAHVAGQAVLLLQANPSWSAAGLESGLDTVAQANPLAAPPDDVGHGLLRLGPDAPLADSDHDGVPDDGDDSGVVGDAPCDAGATSGCDDNCPTIANAALPNAGWLGFGDQADQDGDGVGDLCDICVVAANGPTIPDAGGNSQLDADGDQIGNLCDPDLDGSGAVDALDLQFIDLLISVGLFDPVADLNGDSVVDATDRALIVVGQPLGPSFVSPSCFNALDDNGNGAVDLADPQCGGDPALDGEDGSAILAVPDPALHAALNAALGQAPGADVTVDQVLSLTSLSAPSAGISDLTGLQVGINLVTVDLRNNALSDVSVLDGLSTLEAALLYGNSGLGMPCDLSGDGAVEVADATSAVTRIVSGQVTWADSARMDVVPSTGPGDGRADVADLVVLLRAALGNGGTACSGS